MNYGRFYITPRKLAFAHRVSYALANGPIPDGLLVCHKCDNPICVNPAHLVLGTDLDNARDRNTKGRVASGDRSGARTKPERHARGEQTGCAKLTAEIVREIRRERAAGVTLQSLADRFGVYTSTISGIARRKQWRHVE